MDSTLLARRPVEVGGVTFDAVTLGEGSPTVVFANGMGSPLEEWALVAPTIAKRSRVVCYDRRPAPMDGALPTHDVAQMAGDLHELLRALGVTGPLVLVGHSWGGALIRRYAAEHSDDVAGIVFVDASHEGLSSMVPNSAMRAVYGATMAALRFAPGRRRLLNAMGFNRLAPAEQAVIDNLPWRAHGRTARAEYAGIGPSFLDLASRAPDLPNVPTRVLLAAGRPGWTTKLAGKQLATVRGVWERAAEGRTEVVLQSVPDAGHYICLDDPQAVIDAIEDVVSEIH